MDARVKICGLTRAEDVSAAVAAGVAYIGFNFFPKSPRYVTIEAARALAVEVPPGVAKVGLTVDADDATLDAITGAVPLDMLQLHGEESPERVAEVRARYGLPVIKAVGIADAADVAALDAYGKVADQILVDAKAPKDSVIPGGNGLPFEWRLIAGRRWPVPWMLAGGLTPDNVAEAILRTGARQVDTASGVERTKGVKDAALIEAFVAAAHR
ncbi:phosphoribosylanthranilate isomerase [Pseudooceanicola sp. LIPI14-2-Ac024]|uniref:phosphoribosylanthranilate isomerase n=1 Tax=Pseudooceanicola sp. LIPI14-2-Ac024 TaxID=3344875 RepID=UPI0035CF6B9E